MALAPPDSPRCTADEWAKLRHFVLYGMVFEVQEWVAAGKTTLRPKGCNRSVLKLAMDRKSHSMVRVLWESGWQDPREVEMVRHWTTDPLFLRYFMSHGAPFEKMTGYELCKTNDVDLIRQGMELGIEVVESGGWAKAMVETRGGPLIRFYIAEKDRLPGLRRQALIALGEAIAESRIRAVALLRWAGVDPFERIPDEDQLDLPQSGWTRYPASMLFACEKPMEALAAMNLKPDPDQWFDLLESCRSFLTVINAMVGLRSDPAELIKECPARAAKALIQMLDWLCWESTIFVVRLDLNRIEEMAAGCRRFIELGATVCFDTPESAKDLRSRIYGCSTHVPVMKVFEHAWDCDRSQEGIRELVSTPKMKALVREHAPKLAAKLSLTKRITKVSKEYQPIFNPSWIAKSKKGNATTRDAVRRGEPSG